MAIDSPDGVIDVDPSPVQRQSDYMDISNYGASGFACVAGTITWVTFNLPDDGKYYVPDYAFFGYTNKLPAETHIDFCPDQTAPIWVTLSLMVTEAFAIHRMNNLGSASFTYPQAIRMGIYNDEQYNRSCTALLVYYTYDA